ncbi:MAG: hypothetical protein GQE15_25915 [Archangiaceae bacterium]|nr:hypothetical protein [Archangiaceae bacterium]
MNDVEPTPGAGLINPDLHRLIQLFSALPDVKFPDVDAPMLHELVSRVQERHVTVAHAEVALDAARRALDDEQEQLLKKAHRLHAWLTVMAETDEALREKLALVTLPKLRRTTPRAEVLPPGVEAVAPKKRGRPRKVVPASEGLFTEAAASAS